jgi:DNA-binding NtrC family response regulator
MRIDVRIIAATSRDLPQEIAYNGSFRSDLYYRLNVFHIDIPLLHQRERDIPILANYFLQKLNLQNQQDKIFEEKTLDMLAEYSWPGNVRELANVVESSFYVCLAQASNVILPACLPKRIGIFEQKNSDREDFGVTSFLSKNVEKNNSLKTSIKNTEEQQIKIVIKRTGYNMSSASRLLGISRSTLYRKVKKYHIDITPEWKLQQMLKSRDDYEKS